MGDFMCQPERNQLGVEAEPLCVGVLGARKMLKADESNAAVLRYELASICGTDADHEYDVNVGIGAEELRTLCLRVTGKRCDICSLQHGSQVGPVGLHRRSNHIDEVRSFRIENVIVPVRI